MHVTKVRSFTPWTRFALSLLAIAAASLTATNALADIKRSCHSTYSIEFTGPKPANFIHTPRIASGYFETRRGCGSTVPNRCRERARDQAQACMKKFWQNPNALPAECKGSSVPVFPEAYTYLGPRQAVAIDAADYASFLQSDGEPGSRESLKGFTVNVYAQTFGDTGCAKKTRLQSNVLINPTVLSKVSKFTASDRYEVIYKPSEISAPSRTKLFRTSTVKLKNGKTYSRTIPALMNRKGDGILRAESSDSSYIGCGRKVAQNFLMSLGFTKSQMEQSYVAKYVDLYLEALIDIFSENKATTPGDLNKGINKILGKKGIKDKLTSGIKRRVTQPQVYLVEQLYQKDFPIIALVKGGGHWVQTTGLWSSIFDNRLATTFFLTHNNWRTELNDWRYYSLAFNAGATFMSWSIPSYKPGTMIQYKPTPSTAKRTLKLYVHKKRGDFYSVSTPLDLQIAKTAGYLFVRDQGQVFVEKQPGTVPLKLFWHANRKDHYSTATTWGEKSARDAGYKFLRVQGFVYPAHVGKAGTIKLEGLWGGLKGVLDNMTVTSKTIKAMYVAAGWTHFGTVARILPPKTSLKKTYVCNEGQRDGARNCKVKSKTFKSTCQPGKSGCPYWIDTKYNGVFRSAKRVGGQWKCYEGTRSGKKNCRVATINFKVKQPQKCRSKQGKKPPASGCTYWIDSKYKGVFKLAKVVMKPAVANSNALPTPAQMAGTDKKGPRRRMRKTKMHGNYAALVKNLIQVKAKIAKRMQTKVLRVNPDVQRYRKARNGFMKPCKSELLKYCKKTLPQNRGWFRCLNAKNRRLSRQCSAALKRVK
ncbi:MAG: hypothetical protein VX589_00795 [Myxococcota bacterium]|nr:hypothetical protein [Myxococcota bacterium]